MGVIVIDGRKIANQILDELGKKPQCGKFLGIVLVNTDPASLSFFQQQYKIADCLRIPTFHSGPKNFASSENFAKEISELCQYPAIGGLTIQLPLPSEYNRQVILDALEPLKDPDCLNEKNWLVDSPAAMAVEKVLASLNYDVADKNVAVVGGGYLIGKPVASYLRGKAKNLVGFNSKSDLRSLVDADLVISGTGKMGLIKPQMLKAGAGVIDFGFGGDLNTTSGDLDKLGFYTPSQGGTGPILSACLFENFYFLISQQQSV